MTLPKLKRIKVTSERDLQNWLTKNKGHGQDGEVMVSVDESMVYLTPLKWKDADR